MSEEPNSSRLSKTRSGPVLALLVWFLAAATAFVMARRWLPPLASEHGAGIDRMLHYLFVTVGALFLVGHAALGAVIWRFSKSRRTSRDTPKGAELRWALGLALLVTVIAEGGVLVLGLPVWDQFYVKAAPSDAVEVEVTAEQFGWNVRYPGADGRFGRSDWHLYPDNAVGLVREDPDAKDDVVTLGVMYLPANRAAHIRLRSKDVLHSFYLPNFRVKQDAVPGMTIDFWFVPTQTGTFEIACAELCGFAHYNMRGVLYVVPEQEFRDWLKNEPPFLS